MPLLDLKGDYATDVRPVRASSGRKAWAKDPTTPGGGDGTRLDATFVNDLLGMIRRLAEVYGVTVAAGDDDALADIIATAASLPPRLGTVSESITDWNAALQNGFYASSNTASNKPPHDLPFLGFVVNSGVSTVRQYATAIDGDGSSTTTLSYRRDRVAGSFGAWYRVDLSMDEIDARAAAAVAALVDSSPSALNTLNELAAALGDDPNFATTVTNALAAKAPLASPALTGVPTMPTAAPGTNTTQGASTAFVTAAVAAGVPTRLAATGGVLVTDWNNALQNGWYYSEPGAANAAGSSWCVGQIWALNADNVVQFVVEIIDDSPSDSRTWVRSKNAGTWEGSWTRLRRTQAELDARYAHVDVVARYNDSVTTNDADLPVGSVLLVDNGGSPPNRNATASVYIDTGSTAKYTTTAGGTQMAGTWRACGSVGSATQFQRVP